MRDQQQFELAATKQLYVPKEPLTDEEKEQRKAQQESTGSGLAFCLVSSRRSPRAGT